MRTLLLIMASVLALADFSVAARAAEQKQAQNLEQWRYTFHNGQWWYWLPEARWVYWQNGRWNDYTPPARGAVAGVPANTEARKIIAAMPCILCGFEATQNQPDYARSVLGVNPTPNIAGPSSTYSEAAATSEIGPFYGRSGSVVGHPAFSPNAEVGPFYGKTDSEIGYPAIGVNSTVGPFYGKAGSVPENPVNMGHFPDY